MQPSVRTSEVFDRAGDGQDGIPNIGRAIVVEDAKAFFVGPHTGMCESLNQRRIIGLSGNSRHTAKKSAIYQNDRRFHFVLDLKVRAPLRGPYQYMLAYERSGYGSTIGLSHEEVNPLVIEDRVLLLYPFPITARQGNVTSWKELRGVATTVRRWG